MSRIDDPIGRSVFHNANTVNALRTSRLLRIVASTPEGTQSPGGWPIAVGRCRVPFGGFENGISEGQTDSELPKIVWQETA